VGVAQSAEHRTVAPDVAGSIPVSHPILPITFTANPDGTCSGILAYPFIPVRIVIEI
jgi:hypothetical protein